jgi:hypothetical protein
VYNIPTVLGNLAVPTLVTLFKSYTKHFVFPSFLYDFKQTLALPSELFCGSLRKDKNHFFANCWSISNYNDRLKLLLLITGMLGFKIIYRIVVLLFFCLLYIGYAMYTVTLYNCR